MTTLAEPAIDLKEHPIMITVQDTISGNGFLARITLSGRALIRKEADDGKWWMYGVRPAGIAASGDNIEEAFLRFRSRYQEILIDTAQEVGTFEKFSAEVERFFNESDADNEDEKLWEAALSSIRSSVPCLPPEPFANLPRRSPEAHPSFIKIERVDAEAKDRRLIPSDNVPDSYAYSFPKAA
jgi:predicted RNase H-like HicB family nuclease